MFHHFIMWLNHTVNFLQKTHNVYHISPCSVSKTGCKSRQFMMKLWGHMAWNVNQHKWCWWIKFTCWSCIFTTDCIWRLYIFLNKSRLLLCLSLFFRAYSLRQPKPFCSNPQNSSVNSGEDPYLSKYEYNELIYKKSLLMTQTKFKSIISLYAMV